MTVAALPATIDYFENGSTLAFAAPFRFKSSGDLVVTRYFANGTHVALALGVDYTATGGSTDAGGTVTMTAAAVAGTRLRIKRVTARAQQSTYTTGDRFPAELTEGTFDTAMLIDQEQDVSIADLASRALLLPVGSVAPEVPLLADAEGRVLGIAGGKVVFVANNAVAVAGDVAAAEAAAAQTEADALAVAEDRTAIETLISLQPKRVSKPLDTAITSSTVLVADGDLAVPLGANSLVTLSGHIRYSASAAGDIKWQHAGPTAVSIALDRWALAPGASAYSGILTDVAYSGADIVVDGGTGVGVIKFEATIQNGPVAGNFVFKRAQNTSDATPTIIKAGSYIDYRPNPTSASFAFANAAIAKLGDYSGPVSAGGHNVITFYQPSGISNSYAETMLTGTMADAQLFAGSYTITVDGVSSVVVAPAGWTFVPLFNGLPDAAHRVRIKGVAIDSDIAIRVGGIAPNATRPPDITNYYRIYDPAFATYISKDGALDIFTGLYGGSIGTAFTATGCGEAHRFNADTSRVDAWLYCTAASSPVELLKDGVSVAVVTLPDLGMMERVNFATGLAAGAHEYALRPTLSGKSFYCFAILVDALTAAAHPNRSLYAGYGDSNMEMQVGEDARTHWLFLLAKRRGWANVRRGVGGQSISTWGRDNTALVTSGLSQPADVILNALGTNDYYFSVALATVQADCTTMLANERAGNASSPIVAIGIHDHYRDQANGTPYSNATRVAYNAKIQAAVAARFAAGDHNVFYIDPTGWISVTPGVHLRDSVHLNAAGDIAFEAGLNTALVALGL